MASDAGVVWFRAHSLAHVGGAMTTAMWARTRPLSRITPRSVIITLTTLVLAYLVVVPLVMLLYGSLATGNYPGEGDGLTLSTYREVLSNPRTLSLLKTSVIYSLGSTAIGMVIGTALAWLVHRTDLPFRGLFITVILFPLVVPTVLGVLAWALLLDSRIGLVNRFLQWLLPISEGPFDVYSLTGMIVIRGIMDVPLVFLWLWPAFKAMDPTLEEAAAVSGTRPSRSTWTITLPLMRPALLGTFLISFILSLDDLGVPILIGVPARVNMLATEVYLATMTFPSDVTYASVNATLLLIISIALTMLYLRMTSRTDGFAVVRGKNYRPRRIPLGRWRWVVTCGAGALVGVTMVLPFLMVVWVSLTPYVQAPSWEGLGNLTTRWYTAVRNDPVAVRGFKNSAVLGVGSAVVVLTLGLVVAWVSIRTRSRARKALDILAFTPIAIPGLVIGLALMWLYLELPFRVYGTLLILGIAYVTRLIPYGVRLLSSGLMQIHPELEEAASVAGSGWLKTMRTVAIPLLRPAFISGFAYVFIRAYMELSSSLFLFSFRNEPFSIVAFGYWQGGSTSKTAAYGIMALVMVAAIVALISLVTRRNVFTNEER